MRWLDRSAMLAFWASTSFIVATVVVFPAAAWIRATVRPRPFRVGTDQPSVSVIVTAHNEQDLIAAKLENVLESTYPRDRLEVIVASDGSTDRTNEITRGFASKGVRLLSFPRLGKNAAITRAVAASHGDVLVFTDADTSMTPRAIELLVRPLADRSVGGVVGERRHRADGDAGPLSRMHRRLHRNMQGWLSAGGSVTVAGLLYAIRREHFRAVPPDVVDDLFIPAQVVRQHRRVVRVPGAATYPLGSVSRPGPRFRRMVRMNVQHLRTYVPLRPLFNPFEYGFYSVQLFAQKVARRFLVLPLAVQLLAAVALFRLGVVYRLAVWLHVAFHTLGLGGTLLQAAALRPPRVVRATSRTERDLLAGAAALLAVLNAKRADRWG